MLALTLVAYAELVAAFLAAALDDLAPALRLHPLAEAVLILALLPAGLVGALWHGTSVLLLEIRDFCTSEDATACLWFCLEKAKNEAQSLEDFQRARFASRKTRERLTFLEG